MYSLCKKKIASLHCYFVIISNQSCISNYLFVKMCFSKSDVPILFDKLGRPLDLHGLNQTLWNDKCDYLELDQIQNLNLQDKNLTILQLNIRSLINKQQELNHMLNKLAMKKKSIPKIILLSETHLNTSKMRHLTIPNYKTLSCNRTMKKRRCSHTDTYILILF